MDVEMYVNKKLSVLVDNVNETFKNVSKDYENMSKMQRKLSKKCSKNTKLIVVLAAIFGAEVYLINQKIDEIDAKLMQKRNDVDGLDRFGDDLK